MDEGVRARVESGERQQATRVEDDEGEVAAGGATFRFSVDRPGSNDANDSVDPGSDPETRTEPNAGDTEIAVDDPRYVASVEAVPIEGTLRLEALGGRRGVEFICRQEEGEVYAWRNSCPHEPDVRLDPGWGAMVRDGQIVCHEHGARFEGDNGLCTYGPCRGKVLDPIDVEVREGSVYLTDERFEGCRRLR